MYSKKENAHDEAGWCCAWGRYEPSEDAMDTGEDPENGGENKENEEDPTKKSPPEPREAAITGGVDDIVRCGISSSQISKSSFKNSKISSFFQSKIKEINSKLKSNRGNEVYRNI